MNHSIHSKNTFFHPTRPSRGLFSRLAFPLFVFSLLLAVNGYFWRDYSLQKNKMIGIQKETRVLLSLTGEEQKVSLEETKKKLEKSERENITLAGELSSTTEKINLLDEEISKYEKEIELLASITDASDGKEIVFLQDMAPIKKAILPL